MATVGWDSGRTKTLTIASAAQLTDVLDMGSEGMYAAWDLGIIAPAALTGTVTLQVSDSATGTFVDLQSSGSDVALTAAKAMSLERIAFRYIRFSSTIAEGDTRSIILTAHR